MKGLPADPRFPHRPTHPDLRLLSEIVHAHDQMSQLGRRAEVIAETYVDPASLRYVAKGRAAIGLTMVPVRCATHDQEVEIRQLMGASYFDGFVAGAAFSVLAKNYEGVTGGESDEEDDEEAEEGGGESAKA